MFRVLPTAVIGCLWACLQVSCGEHKHMISLVCWLWVPSIPRSLTEWFTEGLGDVPNVEMQPPRAKLRGNIELGWDLLRESKEELRRECHLTSDGGTVVLGFARDGTAAGAAPVTRQEGRACCLWMAGVSSVVQDRSPGGQTWHPAKVLACSEFGVNWTHWLFHIALCGK